MHSTKPRCDTVAGTAITRFACFPHIVTHHRQVQLPAHRIIAHVRLTRYRIKRWRVSNLQRGAVPQARHRHIADAVDEQKGYTGVQRLARVAAVASHSASVQRSTALPVSTLSPVASGQQHSCRERSPHIAVLVLSHYLVAQHRPTRGAPVACAYVEAKQSTVGCGSSASCACESRGVEAGMRQSGLELLECTHVCMQCYPMPHPRKLATDAQQSRYF